MVHTDSTDKTNTTKSNTYNNQSSNDNTEALYNDLMNSIECFSVLGLLLSRMAYEITHDKQISD